LVRDAVGVSGCSVIFHADEQHDTHGEVVWSWSPGAETKLGMLRRASWATGAIKPVPEEITYKP